MFNHVSEKAVIMKVLSFSKSSISDSVRQEIMKFRDTDWNIIKQDFLHRYLTAKVQEIEGLFVRIGI